MIIFVRNKLKSQKVIELNDFKSKLIRTILMHDSERLHGIILDWMTDKNLYDDLREVTSKYYSKYIERFEKQSSINIHQIELVWKYLQGKTSLLKIYRANKI